MSATAANKSSRANFSTRRTGTIVVGAFANRALLAT